MSRELAVIWLFAVVMFVIMLVVSITTDCVGC